MALNQKLSNFYCSKDNAFEHYMKQKFIQKEEQQIGQTNEQSTLLRNSSLIMKSNRQEKSITSLVQGMNSPRNQQNSNNKQMKQTSEQIQRGSANQKKSNEVNIFSTAMNIRSRMMIDNIKKSSLNNLIQQNNKQIGGGTHSLSNSHLRQQTVPSNLDQVISTEPDTIKLILPSKYFNSPMQKHTQSQKINTKKSKIINEIFAQPQTQSTTKKKNSNAQSMYQNDLSNKNTIGVLNHRISHIIARQSANQDSKFNFLNPLNSMNHPKIQQTTPNDQFSHKKERIQKNYYHLKSSHKKINLPAQYSSEMERNFISPFGDAQFDLVSPSISQFSKQADLSELKELRSTETIKVISPNQNQKKNINQYSQNSPSGNVNKIKDHRILQSKFSEHILQQMEKQPQPQQQQQQQQQQQIQQVSPKFHLKNISQQSLSTKQDKSKRLISNDNMTPKERMRSQLEKKSTQNSLHPNEIAYDKFTLNKTNMKQDTSKKQEVKQPLEPINPTSARKQQKIDIDNNQPKHTQSEHKKQQRNQNLSRALSNYYEEDSSKSHLNTSDMNGYKGNTIHLPKINIQSQYKKNNSQSMSEIIMTNRTKPTSQMRIELPPINQSLPDISFTPKLASLQNIQQDQKQQPQQVFERKNKKKRQTEVQSMVQIPKKQNKLSRQMTADINRKFLSNDLNQPFYDDSQLTVESNQANYYQALMKLKNQNVGTSASRKKLPSRTQHTRENDIENKEEEKEKRKAKIKRNQSMAIQFDQELIESIRHLKILISNDEQMKVFISTFCFIEVEEFCFLLGIFLDSIYELSADTPTPVNNQNSKLKPRNNVQTMSSITSQRVLSFPTDNITQNINQGSVTNLNDNGNEQQILTQSIKLPAYGLERIEKLLKQSFAQANVHDINEKLSIFNENKKLLLPDNLLDEIGGRVLIERIFVVFLEELIQSKEFLRDNYEEQYQVILDKIKNAEQKQIYAQMICEFLKDNSDSIISEYVKERIQALGIQLSSIDFFVLKKRLYHFLLKQNLVITKDQILKIISRLNQLRQVICNDVLFIRNPENLERHIFLSLKSFLVSSNLLKSASAQSLLELTKRIINYITLHMTPNAFIAYLYSVVQEENMSTFLDTLEFLSTQAFEIYSYLSLEDRADLKSKFTVIRQKLGFQKFVTQVFPAPLPVLLNELREWVLNQITDEPLPKEILLKNLENTELLEIIIEFSHPDINSFTYNDSFAAFSFYNFTKVQYMFWVRGFIEILSRHNLSKSDIEIAENFLTMIFPDRQSNKESNYKLNQQSEIMYNESFKMASQQKILLNLPIKDADKQE